MRKSNLITCLVALVISIVVIISSYFHYQTSIPITIFTSKDSTASKFADKHFLDKYIVGESELNKYTKNIEQFSYNVDTNSITLTGYKGVSSRLVIPKTIDGYKVTTIDESLFTSNIDTIVISNNITKINFPESFQTKIECFAGEYCNELKNNQDLKVTVLNDSTYVDFNNSVLDFEYNLKNKEIELVNYIGKDDVIVVPNTINGYPVTKISFDSFFKEAIYIPSNVKNIGFNFLSKYLARNFAIICGATICSLILFILMTIKLNNDSLEKKSNNTIIYLVSYLYLILIAYFSLAIKNPIIGYKTYILQVIITSLIYIILTLLLKQANKNSEKFDKKLKEEDFKTKAMQILEDADLKEKEELEELIKYSDPVSNEKSLDIEKEILELLSNIQDKNVADVKKLLKKRNTIVKNNK